MILFRDSSANKGGVTSSSLEVLAGMSLSDEEFLELMTSPNDEGSSCRLFRRIDADNDRRILRLLHEVRAKYSTNHFRERDCRS